jgi:molybdenum cofactor biosynthesis enzyme MoaA
MIALQPENNTFKTISVQTTYKCQMKCANCYLGDMLNNDKYIDVDPNRLKVALKKLPNRCDIRFIGAEPTMNPHLFELVKIAREAGHRPSLLTNGLKLRKEEYVKQLKEAGINMLGLSMNGGLDDEMYKLLDNGKYAKQKIAALENCFKNRIIPHVNFILIPDNAHALVPLANYMIELAEKYRMTKYPIMLRVKSVGEVGNYLDTYTYRIDEMIGLLRHSFGWFDVNFEVNGYNEKNTCIFKLPNGLLGKITDWTLDDDGIPDSGSKRRGILTDEYEIAPFFEYYSQNEDTKWK